ncbi:MAG: chemotaxis protein CheX [Lachnospiraceae bacterium]|nr:chemotaxis protein CheX [Lachnospiraceae bacterium]
MFAQFFGSYLLGRNAVSPEDLTAAITMLADTHIKLGTLAMQMGYMTADEVDEVTYMQTREDKRFGEIALEKNYLFEDQLQNLLKAQIPDYLLLGQTLVDMGCLTNSDLEGLMVGYEQDSKIDDIVNTDENNETTTKLIASFFEEAGREITEYTVMYMNLIFNNLIRFIGADFTPLAPSAVADYETQYCVTQHIMGPMTCSSSIDMDEATAVQFASRYAKMEFTEFDEYVKASMEDFLNLHNGLFSVNMSNTYSEELMLDPPMQEKEKVLHLSAESFVIPVIYPFGTVYLILTL